MIGDIQLSAQLTFSKITDPRQAPFTVGELGLPVNVSGKYSASYITTVPFGSSLSPDTGDVTNIGFVAIKNMESALIDSATAPVIATHGSAGSTAYSYKVVAIQANGNYTIASSAGSTSTGNATLTSSNYNILTWTAVDNAVSYDIYRSASSGTPSTTGKIGNAAGVNTFNDTGLAGDGSTAPSTTPFNFDIKVSVDGILWSGWVRGGESQVFRPYNATAPATAFYLTAIANAAKVALLIVEA